ncbi:MAG: zf-HC2 domain-containing protein [Candidatus Aminicenantes bacterium]|nr:zf-HC2 domain-containing protein [Candidatus Aminicenantes bacterium]
MTDHREWNDLIPFYCSGRISKQDRARLETHLAGCPACRAEVEFWRSIASEIRDEAECALPGGAPLAGALARIGRPYRPFLPSRLRLAVELVLGQASILRAEIWISTAVLFGMCLAASLVNGSPDAFRFLVPLVAAGGLAVIGGPQNDPAFELSRSTPVSPGKIILARASLVFGFNLVLSVAAGFLLKLILPRAVLPDPLRDGLAPMALLSALALLLSLRIGTANAVGLTSMIWILRLIPFAVFQAVGEFLRAPGLAEAISAYRSLWHRPGYLLALAAILTVAAVRKADRWEDGGSFFRRNPS